MAIIKKTLKYGTALGITYLSIEQRLWSQLSQKEIDHKLSVICNYEKKALTFAEQKTGINVKQWVPNTPDSLNLKNVWNRSVKTGFKYISEADLKALTAKIQKLLNTSK